MKLLLAKGVCALTLLLVGTAQGANWEVGYPPEGVEDGYPPETVEDGQPPDWTDDEGW